MIEIKHLTKTFETSDGKLDALNDVSLKIDDGEIYGIIGMSGAGKSTLVRCINMLERPTQGSVIIDGVDVGSLSDSQLRNERRQITMIFQGFNLLMQRTCLKNVCFPMELAGVKKSEATARAKELLETVGLGDKLNAYPSELSGGQQQRVAIARALMTNPKVLLCDEATSALDPETTKSVLELLKELNKSLNLTIVIISHQMSVIESICNKVAIMDKSEIVTSGFLQDIFLSPKEKIAKKLIYSGKINAGVKGEKLVKLMFEGSIDKPIITNIIQECNILLSVFYAETKVINGKTYGQIIFRLPYYDEDIKKLCGFLDEKGVNYEEVYSDDFC